MEKEQGIKKDLLEIRSLLGQATAAAGIAMQGWENRTAQMERLNTALERAAILSRNALELARPHVDFPQEGTPAARQKNISGMIRLHDMGWLHIRLETLLPHCRFQTPAYLSDTVARLMDSLGEGGARLPYFKKAVLVIDEHCSCKSRTVYDQDNKGWKAVSNVLKGRLFPDDDQFSLGVVLVSTESEKAECNIYVLPADDAGEFFELRRAGLLF